MPGPRQDALTQRLAEARANGVHINPEHQANAMDEAQLADALEDYLTRGLQATVSEGPTARSGPPRSAIAAIKAALDELPSTCRYHGDRIDPAAYALHREACCDTGCPALRRRNAEAALKTLEMQST